MFYITYIYIHIFLPYIVVVCLRSRAQPVCVPRRGSGRADNATSPRPHSPGPPMQSLDILFSLILDTFHPPSHRNGGTVIVCALCVMKNDKSPSTIWPFDPTNVFITIKYYCAFNIFVYLIVVLRKTVNSNTTTTAQLHDAGETRLLRRGPFYSKVDQNISFTQYNIIYFYNFENILQSIQK